MPTTELLLTIAGLAVLDTLSPTTIAVTIVVLLTSGRRSGRLLAVYWGTVMIAYFTLGVVLMLGLGTLLSALDGPAVTWVQAAVGAALLIGSFLIPARSAEDTRARTTPRAPTAAAMVLLGLGTWAFEAGTAVPYFGAVALMTSAGLAVVQWLPILAAYVVVMILPGALLAGAWLIIGERLRPRLERWRARLSSGSRTAVSWIVGIAGALVLYDAVRQLLIEYGVEWLQLG